MDRLRVLTRLDRLRVLTRLDRLRVLTCLDCLFRRRVFGYKRDLTMVYSIL